MIWDTRHSLAIWCTYCYVFHWRNEEYKQLERCTCYRSLLNQQQDSTEQQWQQSKIVVLTFANVHMRNRKGIPLKGRNQTQSWLSWLSRRVFPRLAPVVCFPAHGTGCTFSCSWQRFYDFPRIALRVACSPALGTGFMFSRTWHLFFPYVSLPALIKVNSRYLEHSRDVKKITTVVVCAS